MGSFGGSKVPPPKIDPRKTLKNGAKKRMLLFEFLGKKGATIAPGNGSWELQGRGKGKGKPFPLGSWGNGGVEDTWPPTTPNTR